MTDKKNAQEMDEAAEKEFPDVDNMFWFDNGPLEQECKRFGFKVGWDAHAKHMESSLREAVDRARREAFEEARIIAKKVLDAAYATACVIQAVKDGNYEGDDYFSRLRALRHDLWEAGAVGNKLGKLARASEASRGGE